MMSFLTGKIRVFICGSGILARSSWLKARIRLPRGNVMIYLVVLLLIFGVLGVTMVSLFSTAITSTATRNDNRRALLFYESGMRYATSELVNSTPKFSSSTIDDLNNTTYNMGTDGTFKLKIFDFDFSITDYRGPDSNPTVTLKTKTGMLPTGFTFPTTEPRIYLFIYGADDFGSPVLPEDKDPIAAISGFTYLDATHVDLALENPIFWGKKQQVAFGVRPFQNATISQGGDLLVERNTASLFPRKNGIFEIREEPKLIYENKRYRYANRIDTEDPNYVRLTNITTDDGSNFSLNLSSSSTFVVLSPATHIITAEGKSGAVTYTEKWFDQYMGSQYNPNGGETPLTRKPDIAFEDEEFLDTVLNPVVAPDSPNYITIDNTDRFIRFSGPGFALGAIWFKDTRAIGGQREFCSEAEGCQFNQGIRAFFTLEYAGTGDGLVFALINGSGGNNDPSSIGGDRERSEMLGYSGDSRLDIAGTTFADNSGPRGLFPPKIGLEFDTKVNYHGDFESAAKNYCSSASNLVASTRNDPGSTSSTPVQDPNSKDAVQYVFWGNSSLTAACRANNPSYDDNRHNAEGLSTDWFLSAGLNIDSSPAIGPDGIVYVGSANNYMNAVDPRNPTAWKWRYSTSGAAPGSPVIAGSGSDYTIYFGALNSNFYAITPQGTNKAGFPFLTNPAAELTTKPVVGGDGTIYFSAIDVLGSGFIDGYVYAIRPSGTLAADWQGPGLENPRLIPDFVTAPALSPDGATLYVAATNTHTVYALRTSDGSLRWFQQTSGIAFPANVSVSVGGDGMVYIGDSAGVLWAMDPDRVGNKIVWSRDISTEAIASSAAVGPDGTIYVGTFDDFLFALDPANGNTKPGWPYYAAGSVQSTPLVDANNTVYFGSDRRNFSVDSKNVYALYSDGTEKWRFQTGGDVRGTPAVSDDGSVYIGSFDYNLYAINQFAGPKNEKDRRITTPDGSTTALVGKRPEGSPEVTETVSVGSESDWLKSSMAKPWAVRMEIERSIVAAADGTYTYVLKTWMRQCDQDNCGGTNPVIGSFYEDTRIAYAPVAHPPMMVQTIKLSSQEHLDFTRFIWGFTAQTAPGEEQTATIRKFQLSFIRPNDPVVTADIDWP